MWRPILVLGVVILLGWGDPVRAADTDFPKLGKEGDFTLTPPEVSEGPESGFYLRADAGYLMPDMGGFSFGGLALPTFSTPDSGWSAGGALGYRFSLPIRLEAGIDYLSLGSAETALGKVGVDATVALASVYWDVITIAGFTPYLSGGVGFAITSMDGPAGIATGSNDWGFAYSLGAGVSYALSARWSVDLGYRYLDLGSRSTSAPGGLAAMEVDDLSAHQVRFGIRYALQ